MKESLLLIFAILCVSFYPLFGKTWYEAVPVNNSNQQFADVGTFFKIVDPDNLTDQFSRWWDAGNPEVMTMPGLNNDIIEVMIMPSYPMHNLLRNRFPGILTFKGYLVSNPSHQVRLELTLHGLTASIQTDEGKIVFQPMKDNRNIFMVYSKNDAAPLRTSAFSCGVDESMQPDNSTIQANRSNTLELLKYRLAMATTGEYTQFHGGTVEAGLAAVAITVNRMSGIYERDFGITFELIPNNDTLIYTDPGTDPYNNNSPGQMLGQNQDNLNQVIGFQNYDIGHVLGTSGGGIAGFAVVCNHTSKARGMTGLSSPVGDPFDVDYVSHEVGHQFAGGHTFTFCSGGSPGQFLIEPGSGSTIMGYAGLCGANNVQSFSDDYFHAASLNQVRIFTSTGSSGGFCAEKLSTENHAPTVDIVSIEPISIPMSTPFKLEALATDPDNDAITYCWEQMDHGPSVPMNNPAGDAPLFRTLAPTTSPVRYFPRLQTVILGNSDVREQLPNYARTMTFRVTARDNNPEVGGIDFKTISFSVDDNAGPFKVTFPTESDHVMFAGVSQNVAWDVANTNEFPTDCQSVNILLSINGGQTYPFILAENVPNIGTASVILPNEFVNTARIKVQAADNIFYNISESNFSIELHTATKSNSKTAISTWPNPAENHVNIAVLDNHHIEKLTIYDIQGRMVLFLITDTLTDNFSIDVSDLSQGIYILKVVTNQGIICEKFVKGSAF